MAFSYDDSLSADADKVRFEIGDTVEDAGVRPDGRNFSNAEIAYFLTQEVTVGRAVARAAEVLAREWSSHPTEWKLGPEDQKVNAAEYWQGIAEAQRATYGRADAEDVDGLFDWHDFSELSSS